MWVNLCVFRLLATVVTLIATEGLLFTMGEQVVLEIYSLYAGITALVTGEGLWSIVR